MEITNKIAQKYVHDTLDPQQVSELDELFDSDESYRILGKILEAGKQHKQSFIEDEYKTVTFEQIDNIVLQSLTGKVSPENLNALLYSLGNEYDFLEKLVIRIKGNVDATFESENTSVEKINILTDEELLERMNIKPVFIPRRAAALRQSVIQDIINTIRDFIRSLAIPKPAFVMVTTILILSILFVGTPLYTEYKSTNLTNESLAYLTDNYTITDDMARPTGGFDYSMFGATRGEAEEKEDEGFSLLKEALEYDDENARAYQYLGTWHLFNRQFDLAKENYQKALELNQDNATIFNDLGQLAFVQGDYIDAENQFGKALTLNPQLPEARFNLGFALEKQGKLDEAKKEWMKYLDMDSQSKWSKIIQRNLNRLEP